MKSLASSSRALLALPLVTALLLGSLASAQTTTSAVPGLLSYQGKVTNATGTVVGAAASGGPVNRKVIFRIWSHQNNGTPNDLVYAEEQTVTISEGEFSVLIGQGTVVSGTPLGYSEAAKGPPSLTVASPVIFGGALRYLGVTVDDGTAAADPEVSPRQQLVTSGYAFRAKYAESVGANGVNTLTALDNGNIGIGSANPAVKLEVAGSVRAGGAGVTNPSLSLLANSTSAVALSVGYANAAGLLSTNAAAGDTVMRTDNGGKLLLQSGTGAAALTINGVNQVGIGQANPGFPLNFASTLGDKISLFGNSGAHYGFGVQSNLLQVHGDLSTTDIGFGYGSSSAFTELMRIKGTGNVGIGTSTPAAKLDVNGSVRAAGGSGFTFSGGDTDGGLFSPADGVVTLRTNGTERVRVDSSGNLGIGTTTANAPLSFSNNMGQKISLWTTGSSTYGLGIQGGLLQIHTGGSGDDIVFGHGSSGSLSETMRIKGNGTVGIGTNSPTKGTVQINTWTNNFNLPANTTYNRGSTNNQAANSATSLSLYAEVDIGARQFLSFSDSRIKRIASRSDAARDLSILQSIEVTDYTYIDTATKGAGHHKKVIAQQVEKVFPQAVRRSTDEVPDIYQTAPVKDGWVILATDLKQGERVRLIGGRKEGVFEVLEVTAGRFRTDFVAESAEVFVFGREVKDFRTVDYDALSMLNVSATQELKREKDAENAALRTANAELVQRVTALEAKDRARDAKLASIEKLLLASPTVMARPAPASRPAASSQD